MRKPTFDDLSREVHDLADKLDLLSIPPLPLGKAKKRTARALRSVTRDVKQLLERKWRRERAYSHYWESDEFGLESNE
jgi:hypothetical protein